MKILKKNEIATETARHRREQIEEGMVLANRIDALRRTLADLEKQHNDYISGMKQELGGLQKQIAEAKEELSN